MALHQLCDGPATSIVGIPALNNTPITAITDNMTEIARAIPVHKMSSLRQSVSIPNDNSPESSGVEGKPECVTVIYTTELQNDNIFDRYSGEGGDNRQLVEIVDGMTPSVENTNSLINSLDNIQANEPRQQQNYNVEIDENRDRTLDTGEYGDADEETGTESKEDVKIDRIALAKDYAVTLEEAKKGIFTVISYLEAHPEIDTGYVKVLWSMLSHLVGYSLKSESPDVEVEPCSEYQHDQVSDECVVEDAKATISHYVTKDNVDQIEDLQTTDIPTEPCISTKNVVDELYTSAPVSDQVAVDPQVRLTPVKNALSIGKGRRLTCLYCGIQYSSTQYFTKHILVCRRRSNQEKRAMRGVLEDKSIEHNSSQSSSDATMLAECSNLLESKVTPLITGLTSEITGPTSDIAQLTSDHIEVATDFPNVVNDVTELVIDSTALSNHFAHPAQSNKGVKPICAVCNRQFRDADHLRRHMVVHTDLRPYHCEDCDKSYRDRSSLRKHRVIHTGERPYQCTKCGKCFTQSGGLKSHMLIHSGEKPHECPICRKCFRQPSGLAAHVRMHTGDKPHSCHICGKCFAQLGHVKSHMVVHSGEKNFQCDTCHKKLGSIKALKMHQSVHTGEKPFRCKICDKAFSTSSGVATHTRTHTGERPHICPTCGKAFSQYDKVVRHMRTHTGERPFPCPICAHKFSDTSILRRHMTVHRK